MLSIHAKPKALREIMSFHCLLTEISVENTIKMNTSIRFPKTPDVKDG